MPKLEVRFIVETTHRKDAAVLKQEMEIEFKNMLTKEEFGHLCSHAEINEAHFFSQENHYFDTESFSLKEHGCALRIREKNGQYEMTLKQPAKEGLLESNLTIDGKEARQIIESGNLTDNSITALIEEAYHIPKDAITYFGSLKTTRAETEFEGGLLVLDHSEYLGKEDYELEYEATDYRKGKITFENLLHTLNIPLRHTDNKIKRFYLAKYQQD